MYHVTITDDAGDVKSESHGSAVALAHICEDDGGIRCVSMADGVSDEDLLELMVCLDELRDGIGDRNPKLKILYRLRDLLITKKTEVDLSAIEEMIGGIVEDILDDDDEDDTDDF